MVGIQAPYQIIINSIIFQIIKYKKVKINVYGNKFLKYFGLANVDFFNQIEFWIPKFNFSIFSCRNYDNFLFFFHVFVLK